MKQLLTFMFFSKKIGSFLKTRFGSPFREEESVSTISTRWTGESA
jgi:hypothetical protein